MIIPSNCKNFLKKNIPDYEKYTDYHELIDKVDDLLLYKGMVNQDYLNEFGIQAQRVYDDIYYANVKD